MDREEKYRADRRAVTALQYEEKKNIRRAFGTIMRTGLDSWLEADGDHTMAQCNAREATKIERAMECIVDDANRLMYKMEADMGVYQFRSEVAERQNAVFNKEIANLIRHNHSLEDKAFELAEELEEKDAQVKTAKFKASVDKTKVINLEILLEAAENKLAASQAALQEAIGVIRQQEAQQAAHVSTRMFLQDALVELARLKCPAQPKKEDGPKNADSSGEANGES